MHTNHCFELARASRPPEKKIGPFNEPIASSFVSLFGGEEADAKTRSTGMAAVS
jgi:hypothetical protein